MNKSDVQIGLKVEGGRPYTEDFDQGKIVGFDGDKGLIDVAWQSGTRTWNEPRSLREGWSERWIEEDED